ncbi:hypothetical protein BC828DRAFT_394410 [Blastocladiella britannica]|nr:hypothetical protein BC828DRAFT_394410 [Blastocladiella britannica]
MLEYYAATAFDATIFFVAMVALVSATHTLLADHAVPGIKRLLGYQKPDESLCERVGKATAVVSRAELLLHESATPVTERIDEKLDDGLAIPARIALEIIATRQPPSPREYHAQLANWLTQYPPFGSDLSAAAVDATHDANTRDRLKTHLELVEHAHARCWNVLDGAFRRMLSDQLSLSAYMELVVHALCLEEAWGLLGHFQFATTCRTQLLWMQKAVERWRRSEDGMLSESAVPLFSSPEALLCLLGSAGQSEAVQLCAMYELADLSMEEKARAMTEMHGIELMTILAASPTGRGELPRAIQGLLSSFLV